MPQFYESHVCIVILEEDFIISRNWTEKSSDSEFCKMKFHEEIKLRDPYSTQRIAVVKRWLVNWNLLNSRILVNGFRIKFPMLVFCLLFLGNFLG